jgi:hypothetical protein
VPTPDQALAGALRPAAPAVGGARRVLLVGARGPLGAAVLERLLGSSGFATVEVAAVRALTAIPRGLQPVAARLEGGVATLDGVRAEDAVLVFDRDRRVNGRDDAFLHAEPQALEPLAAALHAAGVRRLTLVTPLDSVTTPAALRAGLATLDEHRVAALGFEGVVFVRAGDRDTAMRAADWPQRLADGVLRQLRLMVPQALQPVRTARLALIASAVAAALAERRASGTRVLPPELVWQAAQAADPAAFIAAWLDGRPLPAARVRVGRM